MAIDVSSITMKDYSEETLQKLRKHIQLALRAVGNEAEGYAKDQCPVDTGRLRNSIAFATNEHHSSGGGRDEPKSTPEQGYVYIGSNVVYAIVQEYGDYQHKTGAKHFMRDAVANHIDHYKAIIAAALEAGMK